jgi:protein ImuB
MVRRACAVAAVERLPIAALRLPSDVVHGLRRLGFDRVSDLPATPRAPSALRFGPVVGRRLDQAAGSTSEPIDPIRPAEMIEVRRSFIEPIGAAETIAAMSASLSRLSGRRSSVPCRPPPISLH